MIKFKELRENFLVEKVTHTTLSAVKSILPAGHVYTHEESDDHTSVKDNDIIVSRNAKHKEHAKFRATSDTGGGDITLASYTSREPEHVAIAAHEAHHALVHHKLKGQGALYSNEQIVNKLTRKWIDNHYVGDDRHRAHAAVDKSEASYSYQLPGQKMQVHRSEREVKEASPMIKPPKNEFGKKEDAFAHAKQHGGKVMKKTFTHPTSGMQTVSYVVKKD